jgi:acyl dehydratase
MAVELGHKPCGEISNVYETGPDDQMDLNYYEDIALGEAPRFGSYEVTKEEIIEFATQYDPQVFHLDEEGAKRTMLGGLSASGWHTAAIAMRLLYDSFLVHSASMGAPGVDELKWSRPVRPGDRLSLRRNILAKKESRSRPDLGIIQTQSELINQNGEVVVTYSAPLMLQRRGVVQQHAQPIEVSHKASQVIAEKPPEPQQPFAGLYFDDIVIGQRMDVGSYTFDKEGILAFGKKYDPQPFHTDEAAARKSHFGGLIASGWHTSAAFMGQLIRNRQKRQAEIVARGEKVPELGPSPGFTNLRWNAPVYAGDTLRFTCEIVNKRAVSRPGWGLVFIHNEGLNQHDRLAYEFQAIAFWQMRT